MLILSLDTSTLWGSIGWVETRETRHPKRILVDRFAEAVYQAKPGHAETLIGQIKTLLKQGDIDWSQIDLIVYGRGPGTFTGLRIGLSTVKGVAFSHDIATVGLSSLKAVAASSQINGIVAPLIDARRGELFYCLYQVKTDPSAPQITPLTEERVAPVEQVIETLRSHNDQPLFLTGNGLEPYREALIAGIGPHATVLSKLHWVPSAYWLARMGQNSFLENGPDNIDTVEPVYLRKPDARLPHGKK